MKLISAVKQKLKKKLVRTIYTAAKPYEIQVGDQPKLAGKTAVVTGGSGAIGRAVCVRLAAEGACVYVGGRREESVMKVVDEIRGHGLQAEPLLVDVTSADSIDAAFDGVFADRKLDVLVCCAGGGARSAMQELAKQSVEVLDSVLTTNLRGTMLCTRKAAQYMTPQGSGRIILISSAVGTLVPMLFKKLKIDPAVASGPLITTMNDLVAVVTYYGMSWLLLIETLHLHDVAP